VIAFLVRGGAYYTQLKDNKEIHDIALPAKVIHQQFKEAVYHKSLELDKDILESLPHIHRAQGQ
jgi:hypothetical protein